MSSETSGKAATAYSAASSRSADRLAFTLEIEYAVRIGFLANAGVCPFRRMAAMAITSALGLVESVVTMFSKVMVCVTEFSLAAGSAITHTTTGRMIVSGRLGKGAMTRRTDATGRRDERTAGGGEAVTRWAGGRRPGDATSVRARSCSPLAVMCTHTMVTLVTHFAVGTSPFHAAP